MKIVNSKINPHLEYASLKDYGYLVLELMKEQAAATHKFVATIKEPGNYGFKEVKIFYVNSWKNNVIVSKQIFLS